jgi:O-antigen/teichoic acid export membrane protein
MAMAQRMRTVIPRSEFIRGSLAIIAGTGLGQLISILSSPVLTRLYQPDEFGSYAVALSILSILITVACLTYENAVPLPESDVAAANVLVVCIVATFAISIGALAVLWLASPWLLSFSEPRFAGLYAALIALGTFGGGIVAAFAGWAIRKRSYSDIAAYRLSQSVTMAVIQIGLGLLGWGVQGLVLGAVAGSAAGASRLARSAWRNGADALRGVSRAGVVQVAVRYRRFPLLSGPSALINTVGLQAPLLLMVALYGTAVGGQFALAQRVIALPASLLAGGIGQTYFAHAARLVREESGEIGALFWKTSRTLALVAAGPIALGAVLSPFLFGLIFGADWSEAGLYVSILAPMYYLQLVAIPTAGTLDVLERQDLHLAREVARLVMMAGAVVVSAVLSLPAIGAVAAVSVAGCLTYLLYWVVSWYAIRVHPVRQPHPVVSDTIVSDEVGDLTEV